jgi:hypothetical protein
MLFTIIKVAHTRIATSLFQRIDVDKIMNKYYRTTIPQQKT